jgi:hypothetical protein
MDDRALHGDLHGRAVQPPADGIALDGLGVAGPASNGPPAMARTAMRD